MGTVQVKDQIFVQIKFQCLAVAQVIEIQIYVHVSDPIKTEQYKSFSASLTSRIEIK